MAGGAPRRSEPGASPAARQSGGRALPNSSRSLPRRSPSRHRKGESAGQGRKVRPLARASQRTGSRRVRRSSSTCPPEGTLTACRRARMTRDSFATTRSLAASNRGRPRKCQCDRVPEPGRRRAGARHRVARWGVGRSVPARCIVELTRQQGKDRFSGWPAACGKSRAGASRDKARTCASHSRCTRNRNGCMYSPPRGPAGGCRHSPASDSSP